MRLALGVAYLGQNYLGWQSQPGGQTVQDQLEHALSAFCDQPVQTLCAGRTDAGVHGLMQVVHLDTALERQSRDTQARLAQLEKNIQALQALKTPAPSALAAPATPTATPAATTSAGTPISAPQPAASETAATPHTPATSEPEAASAVSAAAEASAPVQALPASTASTELQGVAGLDRPTLLWSAAGAVLVLMLLWTLLHQRRQARAQAEAAAAARIEIPPQMASIDLNLGGPLSPQHEDPRP